MNWERSDIIVKPKLFLDFDGVIVDTITAIVDLYNEDFLKYSGFKKVLPSEINSWSFEECKCASSEIFDFYFNTPRFFNHLKFMENAESLLWLLMYDFDVYVVSHGHTPNLNLKSEWIYNHISKDIKFIGVDLDKHKDKSCVDMTDGIFIDDCANNLKTSNATYKFVFGEEYPWNKEYGYIRCISWIDLYKELIYLNSMVYQKE
nr:hypothetical protein [Mediterraneibacter hominis]